MQSSVVGCCPVSPSGDLRSGVPFVQVFFLTGFAQFAGFAYPFSYAEFLTCAQQFVLQENEAEEALAGGVEELCLAGLNGLFHDSVYQSAFLGHSLPYDIYEVIFVVVVSAELFGRGKEEAGCTYDVLRIVIVAHFRP